MNSIRYRFGTRIAGIALLSFACISLSASASTAQNLWAEQGDAGELPGTAQITVGNGPLQFINGLLSDAYDVDMYCIRIVNEPAFLANLQCAVNAGPVPFLFTLSGYGKQTNEICAGGFKQLTTTFTSSPGTYMLAVAHFGRTAVSMTGNIWNAGMLPLRAPDGPGAFDPITSWGGVPTLGPINPYAIMLAGCESCMTPVPVQSTTWGRIRALYR